MDALTKGQREVLSLVVEGQTNKEIARALGLAEITVKVRLTAVYRKLGVKNRVQAVRFVFDPLHGRANKEVQLKNDITIRIAQSKDGNAIERLVRQGGFPIDDLDWSQVYPHWLVSENGAGVNGCIQVCPATPVGRLEMLGIDESLSHRERAITFKNLVTYGLATLQKGGCQAVWFMVPFDMKGFKKVLKRRGAKVITNGNILLKRLI